MRPGAKRLVILLLLSALTFSLFPQLVYAHLIRSGGVWSYRYLSREGGDAYAAAVNCYYGTGSVDPLNIVFYQYGEGNRIYSHVRDETHLDNYSGVIPRSNQWICGDADYAPGSYSNSVAQNWDDQDGHGTSTGSVRAHARFWYATHSHSTATENWSTIDAHHETMVCCPGHNIDEPWDTWEYHFAGEMGVAHNVWYDNYVRVAGQSIQGFWDNGMITRVGGLHNGGY